MPLVAAIEPVTLAMETRATPDSDTPAGRLSRRRREQGHHRHGARDFGGYVRGEDGTDNLRPDQLIPVMWQALRELAADFAAYKSAHP